MDEHGDWMDFTDQVDDLLIDLDDVPDEGEEFAASVREKVEGMKEWAVEHEHVTEKMWDALINMRAGTERWLARR